MRRALAAALGLAVLTGSALVAQASSLTVDAGVLQTLTMPAEIDVPDDPVEYSIITWVRRHNNGNDREATRYLGPPFTVSEGEVYTVSWTEPDELQSCDDDFGGQVPLDDGQIDISDTGGIVGPLEANSTVVYFACVYAGEAGAFELEKVASP